MSHPRSSRTSLPDLLAILAVVVLGVAFYWPVLGGGESLWFRDILAADYPMARMLEAALKKGELPLWEPRIGLGFPFHALPHSGIGYPFSLAFLLPLPLGFNVFTVLHVLLAGASVYLLLRRWCLSRPAALLGGLSLMFSGMAVSMTNVTTLVRSLAWMAPALAAFDGFLAGGGRRSLALTALALAAQGSGTDPQYVLFTAVLLAVAIVGRPLPVAIPAGRALGGLILAGMIACALLAFQYLPLAQLIQWSDRSLLRAGDEGALFAVDPRQLVGFLLPLSFPAVADNRFTLSFPGGRLPLLHDLYWGVGLTALCLAALGWCSGPGTRPDHAPDESSRPGEPRYGRTALALWILAALSILVSLGQSLPTWGWMMRLVPPLQYFRYPTKYLLLATFALPCLAALGLEGLVRGHRMVGRAAVLAAASLALVAAVCLAVVHTSGDAWPIGFLGPRARTLPPPMVADLVHGWERHLASGAGVGVCLAGLMLLGIRNGIRTSLLVAGVVFWVVADLALSTHAGYQRVPGAWMNAPSRAATLIAAHASTGQPGPEPPRYATYTMSRYSYHPDESGLVQYGQFRDRMSGMIGMPQGFASVLELTSVRLLSVTSLHGDLASCPQPITAAVLARLGVRFFVRAEPHPGFRLGKVIATHGTTSVEELSGVAPRAFIARRAVERSLPGGLPTTDAILALPDEAWYESSGQTPSDGCDTTGNTTGSCRITRYTANEVVIDFEVAGRGLLVLTDEYYPGWRARVDGKERSIVRVAGLVRGVEVKTGEHRLVMEFEPWTLRFGCIISGLSLLGVLGLLVGRLRLPASSGSG